VRSAKREAASDLGAGDETPRSIPTPLDTQRLKGPTDGVETLSPSSGLAGFRRVAAGLVIADALCIIGAILAVHALRGDAVRLTTDTILVLLSAPLVWIGLFHTFGLYGVRHLSAPEEFRRLISATTLAVAAIMVGSVWWEDALDRPTLALTWVVAFFLELVARRVARWHIRRAKRLGRLSLRTVIAGANGEAARIAHALATPGGGFTPIGFVAPAGPQPSDPSIPLLGAVSELVEIIRTHSAECVFVASTGTSASDVSRIARACRLANIEMRVSANAPAVLTSRISIQQIGELMMLSVRPVRLTGPQSALKRSFDIVLASLGLIVFLPLMSMIALAITLTSRGPTLFRQERVTKGGRQFTMYKFRTMVLDPRRALDGAVIDLTQPYFKMSHDPRLTTLGKALRPFSLDELPQLWNVLRGDMSLVGPRPLPLEQVAANLELLQPRHEVRAGMTGWWQVSGRSEIDPDAALKMDLFYIEKWSLSLDIYVLMKTLGAVLARKGAY
jgi:exopolysaccharide biosynthesis polyprenyl glycosylphosphotransferase